MNTNSPWTGSRALLFAFSIRLCHSHIVHRVLRRETLEDASPGLEAEVGRHIKRGIEERHVGNDQIVIDEHVNLLNIEIHIEAEGARHGEVSQKNETHAAAGEFRLDVVDRELPGGGTVTRIKRVGGELIFTHYASGLGTV